MSALLGVAGGVLGAIAGAQPDKTKQNSSSTSSVNLQNFDTLNQGRSGLEGLGYDTQNNQFQDLLRLLQSGPGQNEVAANTQYQNSFAQQLQGALANTLNPTTAQVNANFSQAQGLFAPQQEALRQQFVQQNTQSNQLAARLGRAGNDPILRAKLLTNQSNQQASLNADIGSYARQMPQMNAQNIMSIGGQLSNLRNGLASQAMQNRQTLLALGNELTNSERNYRLQTAGRTTNGTQTTTSGGGLAGAISGGLAGAGAFMSGFGSFSGAGAPSQGINSYNSSAAKFNSIA